MNNRQSDHLHPGGGGSVPLDNSGGGGGGGYDTHLVVPTAFPLSCPDDSNLTALNSTTTHDDNNDDDSAAPFADEWNALLNDPIALGNIGLEQSFNVDQPPPPPLPPAVGDAGRGRPGDRPDTLSLSCEFNNSCHPSDLATDATTTVPNLFDYLTNSTGDSPSIGASPFETTTSQPFSSSHHNTPASQFPSTFNQYIDSSRVVASSNSHLAHQHHSDRLNHHLGRLVIPDHRFANAPFAESPQSPPAFHPFGGHLRGPEHFSSPQSTSTSFRPHTSSHLHSTSSVCSPALSSSHTDSTTYFDSPFQFHHHPQTSQNRYPFATRSSALRQLIESGGDADPSLISLGALDSLGQTPFDCVTAAAAAPSEVVCSPHQSFNSRPLSRGKSESPPDLKPSVVSERLDNRRCSVSPLDDTKPCTPKPRPIQELLQPLDRTPSPPPLLTGPPYHPPIESPESLLRLKRIRGSIVVRGGSLAGLGLGLSPESDSVGCPCDPHGYRNKECWRKSSGSTGSSGKRKGTRAATLDDNDDDDDMDAENRSTISGIEKPGGSNSAPGSVVGSKRKSTSPGSGKKAAPIVHKSNLEHPGGQPPPQAPVPKRKKPRIALSCAQCTKRKQKCNRQIPCQHCTSRRVSGLPLILPVFFRGLRLTSRSPRCPPSCRSLNNV